MEISDCTDESRKDETCLQFKMEKHFIKTIIISKKAVILVVATKGFENVDTR